jgi:hypothetical protein
MSAFLEARIKGLLLLSFLAFGAVVLCAITNQPVAGAIYFVGGLLGHAAAAIATAVIESTSPPYGPADGPSSGR